MLFFSVTLPLLLITACRALQSEDDCCALENESDTCMILQPCPSMYKSLNGSLPKKMCGYVYMEQYVTCSIVGIDTTPTDILQIISTKCEEYAKSVHRFNVLVYPRIRDLNVRPLTGFIFTNESTPEADKGLGIAGGTIASLMEFPHMAAIGYNITNETVWKCGGSLISEQFVLTVAHCLYTVNWGPAEWVLLGVVNLQDNGESSQLIKIAERIKHPLYKRPSRYHDIALLRLETEVIFNSWVRPACLGYSMPDTGTEDYAIATGWGATDPNNDIMSNNLMKVNLSFTSYEMCNQSYRDSTKLLQGIVAEWQLCAVGDGKDTCPGDSGGPLVIENEDYLGMYNVIGLTSLGLNCANDISGVYTRVYHYLSWIESIVWQN